MTSLQQMLLRSIPSAKRLFLIDGLGALLSAFFLGIVLVSLNEAIGMPVNVLYLLAFLACTFSVYSLVCARCTPENWRPFLMAIAIVNLLYCCLTVSLVVFYYQELTILGLLYFTFEILIIVILATAEITYARKYIDESVP